MDPVEKVTVEKLNDALQGGGAAIGPVAPTVERVYTGRSEP